jgi:hypothetical protein
MPVRDVPPISKHILKLARQIDSTNSPEYIAAESREDCLPSRCFENVPRVVAKEGGSIQHGWTMRQDSYFAEGAFHAVWRRPDGTLIDVTPRTDPQTQVLFLVDSKKVWEGETVEPMRMQVHGKACYCGSGMPFRICHGLADD